MMSLLHCHKSLALKKFEKILIDFFQIRNVLPKVHKNKILLTVCVYIYFVTMWYKAQLYSWQIKDFQNWKVRLLYLLYLSLTLSYWRYLYLILSHPDSIYLCPSHSVSLMCRHRQNTCKTVFCCCCCAPQICSLFLIADIEHENLFVSFIYLLNAWDR